MKKPLLCFDMDNTLVSSDNAHTAAYNKALIDFGYEPQHPALLVTLYGMPHLELVKLLIGKKGPKKHIEAIADRHAKYIAKEFSYKVKRKPYVVPMLKKLKKEYELAVLSNACHSSIKALLKGAKIDIKLFKYVIGNDDVKRSKPYPDEILKAEKLAHHDAVAMVGDSPYDIRAAQNAGVPGISVLSGHYTKKILQQEKPYAIIKDFRELPKVLNRIQKKK